MSPRAGDPDRDEAGRSTSMPMGDRLSPARGQSRRRLLSTTLAGLALLVGCGQPSLSWLGAKKVYRVGILGESASDPVEAHLWQAFRLSLRERGWAEGDNIVLEYRWTEGDVARLPGLAAELVRLEVDSIVARSSRHTQPAKAATATIPIVFVVHADPVALGHVESLARPGGNVTGLALLQTDFSVKGLELLCAAIPVAARVAVLWNSHTPSHLPGRQALQEPASALGVQLQEVDAPTVAELGSAFATMAGQNAQAVLVLASPLFFAERQLVAELALTHRLPTMFGLQEAVEAGGLMSYGANYEDLFRRAAVYVDKILRGAKPADLPVEQATRFDFVVNLNTARALGLTIPPSLLHQATEIVP